MSNGEGKTISWASHFHFEQFGLRHPWMGGGTWPPGAEGKAGTFPLSKIPSPAGECDPDTPARFVLFVSSQHLQDLNVASYPEPNLGEEPAVILGLIGGGGGGLCIYI